MWDPMVGRQGSYHYANHATVKRVEKILKSRQLTDCRDEGSHLNLSSFDKVHHNLKKIK